MPELWEKNAGKRQSWAVRSLPGDISRGVVKKNKLTIYTFYRYILHRELVNLPTKPALTVGEGFNAVRDPGKPFPGGLLRGSVSAAICHIFLPGTCHIHDFYRITSPSLFRFEPLLNPAE